MAAILRRSIVCLLAMVILTGIVYPLLVTLTGKLVFPYRTQGSLIMRNGKIVGSELIGQHFDNPKYFWSRPSATSPTAYNAASSTGSNLGPTSPPLMKSVQDNIAKLKAADPNNKLSIPADLVTASGSGLDGHISPAAAQYQISRVARARNLSEKEVQQIVSANTQDRQWGFFGELRVNVLELNMAMDEYKK